jgi:hypothetical protein
MASNWFPIQNEYLERENALNRSYEVEDVSK